MRRRARRDTAPVARQDPNRATHRSTRGRGSRDSECGPYPGVEEQPGNPDQHTGCSVSEGGEKSKVGLSRSKRLAASLVPFSGSYAMRGRWLSPAYTGLRNAAWATRNARVSNDLNPLALKLAVSEAEALLRNGERLGDVLEAFAELLMRP